MVSILLHNSGFTYYMSEIEMIDCLQTTKYVGCITVVNFTSDHKLPDL